MPSGSGVELATEIPPPDNNDSPIPDWPAAKPAGRSRSPTDFVKMCLFRTREGASLGVKLARHEEVNPLVSVR